MVIWNYYTVGFADVETGKVEIDFADIEHTDYEVAEFVKFFNKYKRQIHVGLEGKNIEYVICDWKMWAEFLLEHGFHEHALAYSEILNELYKDMELHMEAYIKKLKLAKPIKEGQDKRTIHFKTNEMELGRQKDEEIERLNKNKRDFTFKPKAVSQIAYEREKDGLENDYPGLYVGYSKGKQILIEEDKETLLREASDIYGVKLDLIVKIKQ
jgi:hypothetical protein